MKRLLSGIRPTGELHLGNYFGAVKNWLELQERDDIERFYVVVDLHALTTDYEDVSHLREKTFNLFVDLLSLGLDPEKSTVFLQSAVPQHAELHLLLSMLTPLPWVERNPTFKEQLREMESRNIFTYGFLGYPVLMTADILLYKGEVVPVGEDQIPHLELAREITRRFNHLYGKTFPEPQPLLTEARKVPGLDGRKMSKSYNNYIGLRDDPKTIQKKVMSAITDPQKIHKDDPGHPDVCNVFALYKVFLPDFAEELRSVCSRGARGCVACKKELAKTISDRFAEFRESVKEWESRREEVLEIIEAHCERAKKVAEETVREVKEKMNLLVL